MVELPRPETFAPQKVETDRNEGNKVVHLDKAPSENIAAPEVHGHEQRFRKTMLLAALVSASALGAAVGYEYWSSGRFIQTTDNAYIKADSTTVAPKISGYIKEVLVNDNDAVKAGQVLARIDDRDLQTAVLQAKADVQAADAAIKNVDAQIVLQQSLIDQAAAALTSSKASLVFARSDAERTQRLTSNGVGTIERAEQSQSLKDQAVAAVARDEAALIATRNKLPVLQTQRDQAGAQKDRATALAQQAELNLSYTRIVAPVDGTVGARTIRIGQFVSAGTQLMAVVPLEEVYVVANFKETQLTDIEPGQPVKITVDTFPGVRIIGRVDSVSPGSGSEFSLLPADNATGNFTKVVQRVPVKITIEDERFKGRLRPGMSVVPSVDISK